MDQKKKKMTMKDFFPSKYLGRNRMVGTNRMEVICPGREEHGISDSIRTASPWRPQKVVLLNFVSFITVCVS